MRPLRISMQAFGSYLGRTEIDFTELGETPVFLITGATGGGKTTILDAMCFALYCRATGGRRSWGGMRSTAAPPELETMVDFEFSLAGQRYRFSRARSLYKARGKEEMKTREEHSCFSFQDGVWKLLCTGAESRVRECAEQLLGLTCEQFSQVIVLPQGDFLKLLLSSSRDKASLFQTLFATARWEAAAARLKLWASEYQKQADRIYSARTAILSHESCENIEELLALCVELEQRGKQAAAALRHCGEEQEKQEAACRMAQEFLRLFAERSASLNRQVRLEEQQGLMEEKEARAKAGRQALSAFPYYCALNEARRLEGKKKEEWQTAGRKLDEAEKHLEQARQGSLDAQAQRRRLEELGRELTLLENARQSAARFVQAQKRMNAAQSAVKEQKKAEEQRAAVLALAREQCAKGENFVAAASGQAQQLPQLLEKMQAKMREDSAGELARTLEEGVPCPVCGSVHHPRPARLDGQLEQARQELEKARQAAALLEKAREKLALRRGEEESARKAWDECRENSLKLEREAGAAASALDELERAAGGMTSAVLLEQKIAEKQEEWKKRAAAAEKLEIAYTAAQSGQAAGQAAFQAAKLAYEEARAAAEEAGSRFKKAALDAGFSDEMKITSSLLPPEELEKLEREQKEYTAALEACRVRLVELDGALKGKAEPALEPLRLARDQARQSFEAAAKEAGGLSQRLLEADKALKRLQKLEQESAGVMDQYSRASRLGLLLSGRNAKKVPLQQFVLGIMLDDILSSANCFFSTLSNGRYSLLRSSATGGNALGGLDLQVLDAQSGGGRAVETLSGGELFLASLSLAFGLSDIVQNYSGGVHLDSLFIDEGFGSLDQETLDTAMKALAQLQQAGRTIGIISHVSELKARIGAQIVVRRNPGGGSTANVVI